MPKVRTIIVLLLIAFGLWHLYGDIFQISGLQGVYEEISTDINEIKENPRFLSAIDTIKQEVEILYNKITKNTEEIELKQPAPEKPELVAPSNQSFSIHNVEIGDTRSEVEQIAGEPKRSTLNDYGIDWVAYHENYHNFFMVAYNAKNEVAGLFTNQDLLSSQYEITLDSTRDYVLSTLGEPLKGIRKGLVTYQFQDTDEYNTFLIDDNYVTLFYDKHANNTVTAVQIIRSTLEQQKEEYFGEPSRALKEGFEFQLFDLTNAERVKHGLSVLTWDDSVINTVRSHSSDMAQNNYFSHTNLEGQSPFDRLAEDAIAFKMAGENLAAGQPSSIYAHEGLMNSEGHRENKLRSNYESLTVGVAFNEDGQPFYTENYLTK